MMVLSILHIQEVVDRHKTLIFFLAVAHLLLYLGERSLLFHLLFLLRINDCVIVPLPLLTTVNVVDHLTGPMQLLVLVHRVSNCF